MKAFAAEFDPQAFHLDESAGRASIFRGLVCERLAYRRLTCGFWSKAGCPSEWHDRLAVKLRGQATRPATRCGWKARFLRVAPPRSKPNQGIVTSEARVHTLTEVAGADHENPDLQAYTGELTLGLLRHLTDALVAWGPAGILLLSILDVSGVPVAGVFDCFLILIGWSVGPCLVCWRGSRSGGFPWWAM